MQDKKPFYDPVNSKVNFVEQEKDLLKSWYEKGIVKMYLDKNKPSEKYFSFLDGPITANNPMGVHHAWGRTYKDIWQRYKNMQGFKQRFQNGFDCQGLWVEVEVEKELGFTNKKDIDKYGVAEFIQKCKDRVNKYSSIQTDQSKRLGNFMDWDNSYYTMSDENNYMIWHFLKVCYEKKLIYKGSDVVPWCYRCETAISEHEILTEDYKDVEHTSIYFRLPIKDRDSEYLLIWTTTPWTIPANVAVSVDGKSDYSLVEYDGKKYWIMDALKTAVFKDVVTVIKTVKGSELVGLKYASAFDELPSNKEFMSDKLFHSVVPTDAMIMPISAEEGTGLVHTSTGTGAEDHKLGKKLGLPVMPAITDNAEYLDGFGSLSGRNAKKHPELIIDHLKSHDNGDFLFKLHPYKHRYPACWRCKSELVWKLTDEWYIAIDPVREDMKKLAKKIKWIPSFGLKRELDWLSNMHDWLISKKNRYWGLALPIWECNCGHYEVIGGFDELKNKAVGGWEKFEGHTPHKPFIDEVKIKCEKCGELMSRISDVGNPWLDAGIVPFSTISEDNRSDPLYIINREEFRKWFPTDFITESFPGQFKNWFYSVLAMSAILENEIPYKTVLGFGTALAEDGRPMHKSWGNSIEFNEASEKIGVDVMRWIYCKQNPADNLLFGYKIADETRRGFHLMLWNIYNFFVTYANLDGWKFDEKRGMNYDNLLDAWILARLIEAVDVVTVSLEKYDAKTAAEGIETFVSDISLWYIRRSRERVGISAENADDKDNFYNVSRLILVNLSRILAPFTPFLADAVFTNLTKLPSVHLTDWIDDKELKSWKAALGGDVAIGKLVRDMEHVKQIVEMGHSIRKERNIPVRQPLSEINVYTDREVDTRLYDLISAELNVKKVIWIKSKEFKVELNTIISPELEEEAKTRELIRKIQNERKQSGVELSDRINVRSEWLPENIKLIDLIKRKTLSDDIQISGSFGIEKINLKK